MFSGLTIAILGAALCAALACTGSAFGVQSAGQAGAGILSEKPDLFGKVLVLQALPGTQGIYGFLTAVLIMVQIGLLGGAPVELSVNQGFMFLFAGLPVGVVGLLSGIAQGNTAAASIHMLGKEPDSTAKGITMTALVETYAILSLLISILLVFGIKL
jgi:V/A-type H+-transporting ATPase subunit K